MSSKRVFGVTIVVLVIATATLHVLGARGGEANDPLWGVHLYAFFPPAALFVATSALIVVLAVFLQFPARAESWLVKLPDPYRWSAARQTIAVAIMAMASGTVFWWARARHTLLGDGNVVIVHLPAGVDFNARQPLTAVINAKLYAWAAGTADASASPQDTAQTAIAVGSVMAGVLFVPVVWLLAKELLALRDAESEAPAAGRASWLLAGLLLWQGFVQLFCGYVENYAYVLVAMAAYLWTALRYLRGRIALIVPTCALLVAMALHLSAAILLPAHAALTIAAFMRTEQLERTLRDVIVGAACFALLWLVLSWLGHGYNFVGALGSVAREAVVGGGSGKDNQYWFSQTHLRDFWNEQLLIGPLGILLFLPAAAVAWRHMRSAPAIFVSLVGLAHLGAAWVARDSNLGYARNWDLLAPGGFAMTVAGVALFGLSSSARRSDGAAAAPSASMPALALALALCLYHTAPWIALNASEARSVERMKSLPLGLGRTELVVGNWYLRQKDLASARLWLEKSLQENPGNVGTLDVLSGVYFLLDEKPRAFEMLGTAIRMRPDDVPMRVKLTRLLVAEQRWADAWPHFEYLERLGALEGDDWIRYGETLRGVGRPDQSRRVLTKALDADPDHPRRALIQQWLQEMQVPEP